MHLDNMHPAHGSVRDEAAMPPRLYSLERRALCVLTIQVIGLAMQLMPNAMNAGGGGAYCARH